MYISFFVSIIEEKFNYTEINYVEYNTYNVFIYRNTMYACEHIKSNCNSYCKYMLYL